MPTAWSSAIALTHGDLRIWFAVVGGIHMIITLALMIAMAFDNDAPDLTPARAMKVSWAPVYYPIALLWVAIRWVAVGADD